MEIWIKTIPQDKHRYETCGDYWFHPDLINVRVSQMENEDYEFLVAIHELVEAYLVKKRGISEPEIMAFDIAFNETGKDSEPGDEPDAPYRKEHFFATTIERLMAAELGVDWKLYEEAIDGLFKG